MTDLSQKLDIVITLIKQGQGGEQVRVDLEKLDRQQRETARSADSLQKSFGDLSRQLLSLVGFQQVTSLLRDSIRAFAEQEAAVAKLEGTLRAGGKYTEEYSQEVQDLAGALQTLTGQQDDAILGVSTFLISSGAGRGEVAKLTETVLDLAAGLGTDLNSAAMMVGKALQGESGSFGRFGFQIDETTTKGEQLAQVLGQIESRFGGLGRAAAQTASGELTAISNLIGDIKEQLGQNFLEFYADQIKAMREFLAGEGRVNPTMEQAEGNVAQRKNVENRLAVARKMGIIGNREWDDLTANIQSAFGERKNFEENGIDTKILRLSTVNYGAERDAIDAAMNVISRRMPNKAEPAPVVSSEPTAGQNLDNKEAINALEEIRKLQASLSVETLSGFEKQRAAAEKTFQERMAQIDAEANRGKASSEVLAEAELARFDAAGAHRAALAEIDAKESAEFAKAEEKKLADAERSIAEIEQLRGSLSLMTLDGFERERAAAQINYERELEHIQSLAKEKKISDADASAMTGQLTKGYTAQLDALAEVEKAQKEAKFWATDYGQMIQGSAQIAASGFSNAWIEALEGGDKVFQKTVKNMLASIGQMITQLLIFRAITGLVGGAVSGGVSSASSASTAGININSTFTAPPMAFAEGGFAPRLMAAGGMQFADRATYLPNFNAVAGEAGREMLAVLAQPRMMQIGGVQAAVGNMQGQSMAVVPTSAVDGGGVEKVEVLVRVSPELEGALVSKTSRVAVELVTEGMQRRTPLQAAVRQAAGTS